MSLTLEETLLDVICSMFIAQCMNMMALYVPFYPQLAKLLAILKLVSNAYMNAVILNLGHCLHDILTFLTLDSIVDTPHFQPSHKHHILPQSLDKFPPSSRAKRPQYSSAQPLRLPQILTSSSHFCRVISPPQTLPSPRQCFAACSVATAKCGRNVANASPAKMTFPLKNTALLHSASLTFVTNGCLVEEMASTKGTERLERWFARCCSQRGGFTRPAGTVLLCWWPFMSVRIWEWRGEVVGRL